MTMVHHVRDLSSNQRVAMENLLGRRLSDVESLTIRPARILRDAPTGQERARAFGGFRHSLDTLAERVKDIPEDKIDAAIDEALSAVRHQAG